MRGIFDLFDKIVLLLQFQQEDLNESVSRFLDAQVALARDRRSNSPRLNPPMPSLDSERPTGSVTVVKN